MDAKAPTNKTVVKFSSASSDFEQPEAPLEPNFDDKSDKKRITGPVKFAIDGKEETAWGIDAGPGRRNQERKAVFQCATNVGFPGGTLLLFHVAQNHGGWNSDDHMNNNLGRFRISATTNAAVVADPVPKKVRDILAFPREKRSPAQTAAVFSYWRTTVGEFKETNGKIDALWAQWPTGSTALALMARENPRETHLLKRGDWLKPMIKGDYIVPAWVKPDQPPPHDVPQSLKTFTEPISLKNKAALKLSATYILTVEAGKEAKDDDFWPQGQRAKERGWPILQLTADHNAQWSAPEALVEMLAGGLHPAAGNVAILNIGRVTPGGCPTSLEKWAATHRPIFSSPKFRTHITDMPFVKCNNNFLIG